MLYHLQPQHLPTTSNQGTRVIIRWLRTKHWRTKRWQEPIQVLPSTHTAVKVAERVTWIQARNCRKILMSYNALAPLSCADQQEQTVKFSVPTRSTRTDGEVMRCATKLSTFDPAADHSDLVFIVLTSLQGHDDGIGCLSRRLLSS